MKKFLTTFLFCASLCALVTACAKDKPVRPGPNDNNVDKRDVLLTGDDGALFQPNFEANDNTLVVSDFVTIRSGDEAAADRALMDKILKKAIVITVKDLLKDPELYKEKENEIQRLFVQQYQKFLISQKVLEKKIFGDNSKMGAKIQVEVSREKLTKEIATEIRSNVATRMIIIVRKPKKSGGVDAVTEDYLYTLTESLSGDLVERGFEPKLWNDVRRNIAEDRDSGDPQLEKFLETYVEDSDWANDKDDQHSLPKIILRSRARYLVGFQFRVLGKTGLTYRCMIRADIHDLFNERALKPSEGTASVAIGSMSLVEAREKCVSKASKIVNAELGKKLQKYLQIIEKRMRDYNVDFVGFSEDEISRLETLMAGVITEDVETETVGGILKVKARVDRAPIPLRNEIKRVLKNLGFEVKPKSSKNTITITKQ
ncbi:MAG: hypothetical protein P1V97_16095 [Planctomycetota bacterium]|nr:hypothetical protein [Planctomycetota bacterium]